MRTLLLDSVDSTNSYLKRTSQNKTEPYLFIRAIEQFAGRGRLNRQWIAEKNKALFLSVLLPDVDKSYQLGLVAAFSALTMIQNQFNLQCSLKWPNDLYWQNKKLGGVLSEKHGQHIILGIGINLNQAGFEDEWGKNAVSLAMATGNTIDIPKFSASLQNQLMLDFSSWQNNPDAFLQTCIKPWLAWLGKKIRVEQLNGGVMSGILEGIDASGFLLLKTPSETQTITTGDVKLWLQE